MKKMKKNLSLVAIVGILFATGVAFSRAFMGQTKLGISVALGDEDESGDVAKVNSESSQEASKKQAENQREALKKQTENDSETSKDQAENQREINKKQFENQREITKKQTENSQEDGVEQENGDKNEGQGDVADISKEVAKIESKIASLATSDPKSFEAFNTSLTEIKALIAQLDATTDPTQTKTLSETINHKIESLDKMMEVAFENDNEQAKEVGNSDNEDVAKQYGSSVAQFVHTLKAVEESDNGDNKGIGQQVKVIAQAQNDSQAKVEGAIKEIDGRSGLVKFLVGPKYDSIAQVQTAITENQNRINVLTGLLNQVTDPAVKLVLQDQVTSLQQQNTKLQAFVADSASGISLFGWLAKMFS